jgi:hypothetical protein
MNRSSKKISLTSGGDRGDQQGPWPPLTSRIFVYTPYFFAKSPLKSWILVLRPSLTVCKSAKIFTGPPHINFLPPPLSLTNQQCPRRPSAPASCHLAPVSHHWMQKYAHHGRRAIRPFLPTSYLIAICKGVYHNLLGFILRFFRFSLPSLFVVAVLPLCSEGIS